MDRFELGIYSLLAIFLFFLVVGMRLIILNVFDINGWIIVGCSLAIFLYSGFLFINYEREKKKK